MAYEVTVIVRVSGLASMRPLRDCIKQSMPLEQTSPNKPNFLKVVLLAAGAILVILLIALACVGFDGKRLIPHSFTRTNTSMLVMPNSAALRLG